MTLVHKSKIRTEDRLRKERKYLKLLLFKILRMSALGEESCKNQGSARCMELIYQNRPRGRNFVGKIVDYFLLRLPVSKATRERRKIVTKLVAECMPVETVLYVPCGTATELKVLAKRNPETKFIGMDLDVRIAKKRTKNLKNVIVKKANAFEYAKYPVKKVDVLLTVGLVDYLSIKEMTEFYKKVSKKLKSTGVMITTVIGHHKHADNLMKEFADFTPVYKSEKQLAKCLKEAGLEYETWQGDYGIHSYAIATRKQ